MLNYKRYRKNPVVDYPEREWPNKEIEKAPIWCSVDLRDGNQALIDPMVVEEKIEMFQFLVDMGFKDIEIGFPAASQIEFDFLRQLIDRKMIPSDVVVQVLTQCREELIDRTFEAIEGCKQAIVHIYNSTSVLQRDVVFGKDKDDIKQIAIDGTNMVKERAAKFDGKIILFYVVFHFAFNCSINNTPCGIIYSTIRTKSSFIRYRFHIKNCCLNIS